LELGICLETHLLRFSHSSTAVPGIIREDGRSIPLIWSLKHEFQKRVRPQLLAETEFLDHSFITIGIVGFEIVEQATPLADQHEKTAARAMVLLVDEGFLLLSG
jgi:hypothetical protein